MKKAALVTGGAQRIGAAISRALAEDGYFLHVHYSNSAEEAEALVAELKAKGQDGAAIRADLSEVDAVEGLVAAACAQGPQPTVLINSASIFLADHIGDMSWERWQRHLDVNVTAPTLLIRDFAARLGPDGRGLVVNFLDYKLANLNADFFSYTVSKYALKGVTETLAIALAPRVRVCGLAPGLTLPSPYQSEADFKALHDRNPLRCGATVEDHVRAIRFMIATPSYSGQMMLVDGGQHFDGVRQDVSYLKA